MSKTSSWVRPTERDGARSTVILAHEQTHFNISEYYARKARVGVKKLIGMEESRVGSTVGEATKLADNALIKAIEGTLNPIDNEWHATQNKYDLETEHSQNMQTQLTWTEKVNGWLNESE